MLLSIIIPVLNDADKLEILLQELVRKKTDQLEIIVIDAGSSDNTWQIASAYTANIITSVPGRANQMNAGAEHANGDVLWFLHADSVLSVDLLSELLHLAKQFNGWGFFKIRLSGQQILFRIIETMMNQRSFITKIATGDQGIFINRDLFNSVGGFPEIPLMEDIAISKQLKRRQKPVCMQHRHLTTSSRRWEEQGIIRTILLMWRLRLAYFLGADPKQLVKQYY